MSSSFPQQLILCCKTKGTSYLKNWSLIKACLLLNIVHVVGYNTAREVFQSKDSRQSSESDSSNESSVSERPNGRDKLSSTIGEL